MEQLQRSLDRIEAEVKKKSTVSPWITSVLIPLLIAAVTAIFSVRSVDNSDRANQLKQIEVLHTVVKDFSTENPEKTLVLLDVVKSALPLDKEFALKLEAYALTLTKQKVKNALVEGGTVGAAQLDEVLNVVGSSNAAAAKSVTAQITGEKFHVIVVSDTTRELATAFKRELVAAGFSKSEVIATSRRFAVSLGEFDYESAKKIKREFEGRERFHTAYENVAFLEKQKPTWSIVNNLEGVGKK